MQWAQIQPKTKLPGCKSTHVFTVGKWFDDSCFEYTLTAYLR